MRINMSITSIQTINILNIPFKLSFVEEIPDPYLDVQGVINESLKTIDIRLDSEPIMTESLIHEYIHGSLYIAGVSQMLPSELNEAVVHCITNSIIQLCKINLKSEILKRK